jgi:hypothetical protein
MPQPRAPPHSAPNVLASLEDVATFTGLSSVSLSSRAAKYCQGEGLGERKAEHNAFGRVGWGGIAPVRAVRPLGHPNGRREPTTQHNGIMRTRGALRTDAGMLRARAASGAHRYFTLVGRPDHPPHTHPPHPLPSRQRGRQPPARTQSTRPPPYESNACTPPGIRTRAEGGGGAAAARGRALTFDIGRGGGPGGSGRKGHVCESRGPPNTAHARRLCASG